MTAKADIDYTRQFNSLTPSQQKVMKAALEASDGWIVRGSCRIWGIAPTAIKALTRKGHLQQRGEFVVGIGWRPKARLTESGRAMAEAALGSRP